MPIVEAPLPPVASVPEGQSFAALLRAHTQSIHREAERSGFIASLLRGRAHQAGYALYLFNLLPIYETLEARLNQSPLPPLLQAFAVPGLARVDSLRHDLCALREVAGPDLHSLPEGTAYTAAVAQAAAGYDAALAAHAYARYLGDLSGGQILKPLLGRSLALTPAQLTFYDFPGIADLAAAKAAIRETLDLVDPGSREAQIILGESVAAFRHMIALSEALAAGAN